MDRRERSGNPLVALEAALEGWQAQMWTAMPARVTTAPQVSGAVPFNPSVQTVTLEVLVQVRVQQPTGDFVWQSIPPLVDVPVFFPSAGGCTITFPVKVGDEGLVVFASRCHDAWWQNGGPPQPQVEFRMHDLSDAVFFPGIKSKPHVIPAVSTTTAQFRSDTGATYVEVDPHDGFVNIVTPGSINATAGESINAHAGTEITAVAGTDITATAGGNGTVSIGGDLGATVGGSASVSVSGTLDIHAAAINLN